MKGNVYRLYIEQIRKVVNKRKKRSLEENSVMNKRRIVKEIMNPYMDKNGFTLAKYERGDWYYRKKIEGALLEICISDCVRRNVILWNYGRKLLPGWRKRVNIL